MENKKIIDYVVVSGSVYNGNNNASLRSLIYEEKNVAVKISNHEMELQTASKKIDLLQQLIKEFQVFANYEVGKMFEPLTVIEKFRLETLNSLLRESHYYIVPDKMQGEKKYKMSTEIIDEIKHGINKYETNITSSKNTIQKLEVELKSFKAKLQIIKDIIQITGRERYPNELEQEVMYYTNLGYVTIGGVNVKQDLSYQAMVKYADE
jgi:DNA repair ATPase RecN